MNFFTVTFFILGAVLFIIALFMYLIAPKYDKAKHSIGMLVGIATMLLTGWFIYQGIQS